MNGSSNREQYEALKDVLAEGVDKGMFTGATVHIGSADSIQTEVTAGTRTRGGPPVTSETKFDIASLSKVVATTNITVRLVEEGLLTLSSTIDSHIPEISGSPRGQIPVRTLLTHTSGLPPYKSFPFGWESKDAVLESLFQSPLSVLAKPDKWYIYSDLNFVFLAEVLRRVTDENLSTLFESYVVEALGLADTTLGPVKHSDVAATKDRRWENRILQGEIHDYLGRAMGGESGNSGVFTTGRDLATIAQMMLSEGEHNNCRFLSPWMIKRLRTDAIEHLEELQGLGWKLQSGDTPATAWETSSFGHTGFTGTSMWMDPVRNQFVVLLTNHVLAKDPDGSLSTFRQRVHEIAAATGCPELES